MDKETKIQLLADLSNAKGASGFEDEVVAVLRQYTDHLGVTSEDSLRNFYVNRHENTGKKPIVMLDAHSDEVSFIVQAIMPNGMLRFLPLGWWVEANVPAHEVYVLNKWGDYIPGVIASKPPHFMTTEEMGKLPHFDEMVIDLGSTSAQETREDMGIRIGAPVVPAVEFRELSHKPDWFMGKAFDCRIGCAAEVMTLEALAGKNLDVDVVGVFSVQEEVGDRGAALSVNQVKPDLAICFEGCPADDTFSPDYMIQSAVGRGPMLRHFDRSMIANPRFQRYALDLAEERGIPCQDSVRRGGGNDGAVIHISNQGVPTIVIGVPVRYAHTHYGLACYQDMEAAKDLAVAICEKISPEEIAGF